MTHLNGILAKIPTHQIKTSEDLEALVARVKAAQQKFATFGVIPKTATSQKVGQMTAEEIARWVPVIRDNNIRAD